MYSVNPTMPIAAGTPSAAVGYSAVSSYDINSLGNSGIGSDSHNSTSLGSAMNVLAYYGSGGRERVYWTLLLGAVLIGVGVEIR